MKYLTCRGRPAGEPFSASFSFCAVKLPTLSTVPPLKLMVPSKSATPWIPAEGSMNPDAARSSLCTLKVDEKGVAAALPVLNGPKLPFNFASPPPGNAAVKVKGNCEVAEKLVTSRFTLSYTRGFCDEFASPTSKRPFVMSSLSTDKAPPEGWPAWGACAVPGAGGAACAGCGALPPRVEKFHFPFAAFSMVICGSSRVREVMCSVLEKTSGIISTPTLSDLAVTNGFLLYPGSSAIEMLSADTVPEKS